MDPIVLFLQITRYGTRVENGRRREAEKKNFNLDCGSERNCEWVRYVHTSADRDFCQYA